MICNRVFNKNFLSRYVFFFQIPWLPEYMCCLDDMSNMEKTLQGRKGYSNVTEQDIEAFKFTFGKTGELLSFIHCSIAVCACGTI